MTNEAEKVDAYLAAIDKLEPDLAPVDTNAALTSIAISMKRVADSLEKVSDMQANAYGETGIDAVTGSLSRTLSNLIGDLGMTLRHNK